MFFFTENPSIAAYRVESKPAEHTIAIDGVRVRYLKAGDGPALLLLHGVGDSALDWQWLMPIVANRYTLYAPDLPGTIALQEPDADYSAERTARFAMAFLAKLDIQRAILVGNSFGGLAALHMAVKFPERVTALVLIDSAGLGKEINPLMTMMSLPIFSGPALLWAKSIPGAIQRAVLRSWALFARPYRAPREWLREQYQLALRPSFLQTTQRVVQVHLDLAGQRQVLLDVLPDLKIPILIVWGGDDRLVPVEQAHRAVERIADGRLRIIPDCGHLPHVEQSGQFAADLNRFVSDRVQL
jgi:4,5:9,10-diseco-3-hydroxy-5,9,17-trioxoandrosta-1(10),2-diene-4-oate hydrolase